MKTKTLKFILVGDLHGQIPKIRTNDFDAIICPGDICGDDLRPYIKKWIKARSHTEHDVDFNDFCPKKKQTELRRESIKKGRSVLKHLNSFGKPVFVVPGNWDLTPYVDGGIGNVRSKLNKNYWPTVKKGFKNVHDVEFRKRKYRGIVIIGHGSTSAPEPLERKFKKDFTDKDIYETYNKRYTFFKKVFKKLSSLFKESKKFPTILISHNVPYKTKLDKVHAPGTYAHNKHYGSIIAKELIKKYKPTLCVGGHIHEGYGKTRVGKTTCINAGFRGDVNTIVEIDVTNNKILNIEFLGRNRKN